MSDLTGEARAQAREEIGRMYTQAVYGEGDWSAEGLAAADALLANFEYVAALLGFVAAGEVEHAWRCNDVIYPEDWVADGPPHGFELIRRTVGYGPWEKATNVDT